MKKIGLVIMAVLLVWLLSGCYAAQVTSELNITSPTGAGTKTIAAEVLKDEADHPTDAGQKVTDNSKFFPNGVEPVVQWLKDNVPEGFTVDLIDKSDRWIFTISYSFTDINDYNAKSKLLMGADRWEKEEVADTVLTAEAVDGGHNVSIKEDARMLELTFLKYFEQIYNNPDLFDPKKGDPNSDPTTLNDTFNVVNIRVDIGSNVTDVKMNEEGKTVIDIDASGFIPEGGAAAGGASDGSSNPATGDRGIALYVTLATASLAAIVWLAVRRKKSAA
jgi:LPXTG-motif cell wall-anchored protein